MAGSDIKERPIVCATDFSEPAREAADVALAIARKLGTKLLLLHGQDLAGVLVSEARLVDEVANIGRERLREEAGRLGNVGVTIETKLLAGSIIDQIVGIAANANACMIVVGAVGRSPVHRLLIGSVAERVAETSSVPTLVVRPGSRLGAWLDGEHTLNVLVGYDFSEASDAALRWLNSMPDIAHSKLTVAHVNWPPQEARRVGHQGPLPLTENPEELQTSLERDVCDRVARLLPSAKVNVTIEPGWGRVEGYLFLLANSLNADLVVIGTHQRHGLSRLRFGSVSRDVLHNVTTSVAVIPPAAEQSRIVIPNLNRVLVATDFSELGNKAVPYGCAILRRGGTLKLIHILPKASAAAGAATQTPGEDLEGALLALLPAEAAQYFDIETATVQHINAAEAIAHEAERFDADAICLGSHGRTGMAKMLLGSVAAGVVNATKRPAFIVRS